AREAHAPVQQNDYANYINAIQSLDEKNASSRLLDLIMTLGAGSIHAYRMGIMTIMIQSSNALSQLRLLSASEEAIDSSTLIDAEPGDAYTRINDWLIQAMRDCIDSRNSKYDKLAEEIEAYIDQNCGDVGFTAETIADRFGFSAQYLSRVFKKQTGEGLSECITAARIRKAKALLSMTDDPIANIAAQCGFLEAQYFHRVFKSKTGMTPGTYRQETRSKAHEGGNNG
ncbi:MAG: helix-turn-helix transcriptional regulator, partial [Proteobacteria bacterium]|nr:helix-turn-helix transcriptional regulator [Pseudomonadota bacterium]